MSLAALRSIGVLIGLPALFAACSGAADAPGLPPAAVSSAAQAWLGDDPGGFVDGLVRTINSLERPFDDGLVRLGTTWGAEIDRARKRFVDAKTTSDVYYALVSLKNSYHDVHSRYGPLPFALVPRHAAVVLPLDARVEYTPEGAARYVVRGDGVPADSTVEAVDDVPIADIEASVREWYPFHAIEGLREATAQWLAFRDSMVGPAPHHGDLCKLTVRAPDGKRVDVMLTWSSLDVGTGAGGPPPGGCCSSFGTAEAFRDYVERKPLASGANWCTYAGGEPGLVVARTCSFDYPNATALRDDQRALLDALRAASATRVLFDVRENGGGTFDPTFFAAFTSSSYRIPLKRLYFAPAFRANPALVEGVGLFLDPMPNPAKRLADELQANPDATYSSSYAFFCKTPSCGADETVYAGASEPPPWKAAILTGPSCVSACDDFVAIMKDNGIASLVGMPTAAADAPFQYTTPLRFANGATVDLTLTVGVSLRPGTQTVLEGNPPAIDVPVPPTAANRGRYLEAALLAAPF